MKKTYSTPQMNIVWLNMTQPILSGSIDINSTGDPIDAGGAAAPERYFFDEEF